MLEGFWGSFKAAEIVKTEMASGKPFGVNPNVAKGHKKPDWYNLSVGGGK